MGELSDTDPSGSSLTACSKGGRGEDQGSELRVVDGEAQGTNLDHCKWNFPKYGGGVARIEPAAALRTHDGTKRLCQGMRTNLANLHLLLHIVSRNTHEARHHLTRGGGSCVRWCRVIGQYRLPELVRRKVPVLS